MKTIITILLISISCFTLKAQPILDFNKFPVDINDNQPILTKVLLKKLNWESIKKFCDTAKEHYIDSIKGDFLVEYNYQNQGKSNYFSLVSFKGLVLKFKSEVENSNKPSKISYFDKNVWMAYVNDVLPELPDSLKLSTDEKQETLEAYYTLLGVGSRDEYGWICEYSTFGMAPQKREAIIKLMFKDNLLRKLIKYPNVQTQMYATDALIYIDYLNKQHIKKLDIKLKQQQEMPDSLKILQKIYDIEIDYTESERKRNLKELEYYKSILLKESDWQTIYELRDSHQPVKICGNNGSYKIYKSNTSELLSDEAIANIPKRYEELRSDGYFR